MEFERLVDRKFFFIFLMFDRGSFCFANVEHTRSFSDAGSNPESGPNSPPTVNNSQASPTAGSNTAIQEVNYIDR